MVDMDIEATAGAGTPALQAPENAHHGTARNSEQGPPIRLTELPQMEPGLRNRHPAGQPTRDVVNDGTAENSQGPPEPTSDGPQTPDTPRFASLVRTGSKGLQTLITTGSWSTQSPEELKQLNEARGFNKLKNDRVEDFEAGYPQLAAFVNSDDTFANYRRFGRLSSRILLHMQNDLYELEKKLDALDRQDAQDDIMKYRLKGYENFVGWDGKHQELRAEIQKKYLEYDGQAEVLLKDASLRTLEKAPVRNHIANFTWMHNEKPLNAEKREFMNNADDFVSISRHTERRFEDFIESWLDSKDPNFFVKRFLKTAEERRKTDSEYVDHYSKSRLALLAIVLQVLVVAVLFLVPVFILFLVPTNRAVMAVTASVFVLAFTVAISFMTGAKIQEIFFGTAAYAAVIIMFLGNINQSGPVQTA
ncbi:hypothetical protein DL98DRAFT_588719 [Cadophora sp. DSE1049]|nr:hypothetical protein DL98DRAFT_588719 [Cadophora sp. DSE1049]